MNFKPILVFCWLALMLSSCDRQPVGPAREGDTADHRQALSFASARSPEFIDAVRVMTRNIYVGTDVDVVLGAEDPQEIPVLVAQAFQTLISTNFPERALSLAREIAATKPHLIGLQEVSLIRRQSPGDAIVGGTVPAEEVLLDYLDILMAALNFVGMDYQVAGIVQNADVELPMVVSVDPLKFDDVRLTDHDVVLVRSDVDFSDVEETNYQVHLTVPSVGIEIPRGYVSVRAEIDNIAYRFVNTHLEPAPAPEILPVQLAQVSELLQHLAGEELPVIMVGDFNSPAPLGATYQAVLRAGYQDVWRRAAVTDDPSGNTYGHDADLRNETANFYERIDFIFMAGRAQVQLRDPVGALVVGDEPENRTPSGLWPSDHGGVVARMRMAKKLPFAGMMRAEQAKN